MAEKFARVPCYSLIIGSDQHYDPPATVPLARGQQNALLTDQLPPDLKRKIGMQNALRIYGVHP